MDKQKIGANSIRVGNILEYNGKLFKVYKTSHTQPGKGGAFMQVEMKDIREDTKLNVRFRSSEDVYKVRLEERPAQYLYEESGILHIMDKETFDQLEIPESLIGEDKAFLEEGGDVALQLYGEEVIAIRLPDQYVATIKECEPSLKGQTATSSFKPAVLENGVKVMVPQFINVGDKIVVNVENREYLERANK